MMANDNPYEAPKMPLSSSTASPKPLLWSGAAVIVFAIMGGLAGVGMGAALGNFVPGYYRSVFAGGDDPGFDPVAVGIGQGLTQGVVFGAIVGLAVAAIYFWLYVRPMSRSS